VITHDDLAFAIAEEAVSRIRSLDPDWSILSTSVHATSSRTWPVPDFVIVDGQNNVFVAAEFKPPNQTKREYLTGVGQAVAYTRDFHHAILIVPSVADDDYRIADHILSVLDQAVATNLPLGLLEYDPRTISPAHAAFTVLRQLQPRIAALETPRPSVEESFWAKWRDISPQELGLFLEYLYDEGRPNVQGTRGGTIRDRAFDRLWLDVQAGRTVHWGGLPRHISNAATNKVAWSKNYRNFLMHLEWTLPDGKLTLEGLAALQLVHQYGSASQLFQDEVSQALLLAGKHLVLINLINRFQDARISRDGPFPDETTWLSEVEDNLADNGLLKRNPGRHGAAVMMSPRAFLKAEKTLWRNLGLFVPRGTSGGRAFHTGRGLVFDWSRITALISS